MVIGGPWAGKSYEGRAARMVLHVAPSYVEVPDGRGSIEPVQTRSQHVEYVFTELFGVKLWVPRGWSQDDIAREVFSNYRPLALREVMADAY